MHLALGAALEAVQVITETIMETDAKNPELPGNSFNYTSGHPQKPYRGRVRTPFAG